MAKEKMLEVANANQLSVLDGSLATIDQRDFGLYVIVGSGYYACSSPFQRLKP